MPTVPIEVADGRATADALHEQEPRCEGPKEGRAVLGGGLVTDPGRSGFRCMRSASDTYSIDCVVDVG